MKLLLLILLIALSSCKEVKQAGEETMPDTSSISKIDTAQKASVNVPFGIDTVLERNSPEALDFSKHQLFIDTTRNSRYYQQIIEWKPNKYDIEGANHYFEKALDGRKPSKVDLGDFPRQWISIYLLNGKYYAHNPINAIDWRMELTDSSVNDYAVEGYADAIAEVHTLHKDELLLELYTSNASGKNETWLQIKKTQHPYLYTLLKSDARVFTKPAYFLHFITPLKHLKDFDLVVSDAPSLVNAYMRFDKIYINKNPYLAETIETDTLNFLIKGIIKGGLKLKRENTAFLGDDCSVNIKEYTLGYYKLVDYLNDCADNGVFRNRYFFEHDSILFIHRRWEYAMTFDEILFSVENTLYDFREDTVRAFHSLTSYEDYKEDKEHPLKYVSIDAEVSSSAKYWEEIESLFAQEDDVIERE